jgi:hypothetical protein
MIEDMGGPGAVPPQGDVVDMIQILEELSMVEVESTIQIDADGKETLIASSMDI